MKLGFLKIIYTSTRVALEGCRLSRRQVQVHWGSGTYQARSISLLPWGRRRGRRGPWHFLETETFQCYSGYWPCLEKGCDLGYRYYNYTYVKLKWIPAKGVTQQKTSIRGVHTWSWYNPVLKWALDGAVEGEWDVQLPFHIHGSKRCQGEVAGRRWVYQQIMQPDWSQASRPQVNFVLAWWLAQPWGCMSLLN